VYVEASAYRLTRVVKIFSFLKFRGSVVVVANEFSKLGVTGQNRLTAPFSSHAEYRFCLEKIKSMVS
jgi:hypothetical protein